MGNRKMIVEVRGGGSYWLLKGGNGETIAHSQTYVRPYSARKMARTLAAALGTTVREAKKRP